MKKRLRVIKKEETELSPIEVALDEMRQRVAEIEEVVFSKPTDIKKLQLKLQVRCEIILLFQFIFLNLN